MTKINNKHCAIAKIAFVCTIHGKKSIFAWKSIDILYRNNILNGMRYPIPDITLLSVKYSKNMKFFRVHCVVRVSHVTFATRVVASWVELSFFFLASLPCSAFPIFTNVFASPPQPGPRQAGRQDSTHTTHPLRSH